MTEAAQNSVLFKRFPQEFVPFHWHGDTFESPDGVQAAASSQGCANQAFEYGGHVVGLQFHLENSDESIGKLIEHCGAEIEPHLYVQHPEQMMDRQSMLAHSNNIMTQLLDTLELRDRTLNEERELLYKSKATYPAIGD